MKCKNIPIAPVKQCTACEGLYCDFCENQVQREEIKVVVAKEAEKKAPEEVAEVEKKEKCAENEENKGEKVKNEEKEAEKADEPEAPAEPVQLIKQCCDKKCTS